MTDRLTDAELDALLTSGHFLSPADSKEHPHCWQCGFAWPCETWRLATEVRELRAVKAAAIPAHGRLREFDICLCDDTPAIGFDGILDVQCDLQIALTGYEEGGR